MRLRMIVFTFSFAVFGCALSSTPEAATCPSGPAGAGPVLSVMFSEALRIRCMDGHFRSESGADLRGLQQTFEQLDVVDVRPLFTTSSEDLERLYRDARARGEEPSDLLSWHFLALPVGADTTAAIATLLARAEIEYAYLHSNVNPPPPGTVNSPR